jgi:predicted RNA polymerase sigma factor
VLVRRYEDFAGCEDAVQEALVAAAQHWTKEGGPSNPRSWLVTAASRAVVDEWPACAPAAAGRRPSQRWNRPTMRRRPGRTTPSPCC